MREWILVFESLRTLSDEELLARAQRAAGKERRELVELLLHLGEIDARSLPQARGFPSLFEYCRRRLGCSEESAYARVHAARAGRSYPLVLEMIEDGTLHLTGAARLAPHLNAANVRDLLGRAGGKSRREIDHMAAQLAGSPAGPCADVIRPLPSRAPAGPPPSGSEQPQWTFDSAARSAATSPETSPGGTGRDIHRSPPTAPAQGASSTSRPEPAPSAEAATVAPRETTAEERRARIAFTAGEPFLTLLEEARALLWHRFPAGRLEEVLGAALDLLVRRLSPGVSAAGGRTRAPRAAAGPAGRTRTIPKRVRAEVWRRDAGRCSYVSPQGTRCSESRGLEFDHIEPFARGGRSDDAANIRLLCRAHNLWRARLDFPVAGKSPG